MALRIMTASVTPTFLWKNSRYSSLMLASMPSRSILAGSFQFSQVTKFSVPPRFAFFSMPFTMYGTRDSRFLPPTALKTTSASAIASAIFSASEKSSAFAPFTTQFFSGLPSTFTVYWPRLFTRSTRPSYFSTNTKGMPLR